MIPELKINQLAVITATGPVAQALKKTGTPNLGISCLARHHPLTLVICSLAPIQNLVRGIL